MRTLIKRFTATIATAALVVAGFTAMALPANAATLTAPGAPTGMTLTAGLNSLSASWTAPVSDGGSAITGYNVTYSTSRTFPVGATTTVVPVTGTTTTLTSLATATTYYVKVAAVNAVGTSVNSTATSKATFGTASAPTSVKLVAGTRQASLTWVAPTSTGGTPVTGYKVQYSPDPTFASNVTTQTLGLVNSTTLNSLWNNTTYYVKIASINAAGTGTYSAATTSKTFSVPTVPASVTLTPGLAQITAKWTAPTSTGGTPVTGYKVQYSTDSTFATGATTIDVAGTVLTTPITGLTHSTTYYVRVAATNAVGTTAYTTGISTSTFATPGEPTTLTATRSTQQTALTWKAPLVTGGSPIRSYKVQYSTDSTFATGVTTIATTTTATTLTIKGLANNTTYFYRVAAVNAVGPGSYMSVPVSALTYNVPAAPTAVTAVAGPGTLKITYTSTPALSNGGTPITGYIAQYSTDSSFANGVVSINLASSAVTTSVTGLAPGTTYYVRVLAKNAAGNSDSSNVASATTTALPQAPTNVTLVTGTTYGTLTARWVAPTDTAGAPITGTVIQYSADAAFPTGSTSTMTLTGTALTATIPGLASNTSYYARVATKTAAGTGAYTNAAASAKTLVQPAAPATLTATAGLGSVTASWTAVTPPVGTTITGYTVLLSTSSTMTTPKTINTTGTAITTATFTGLTVGTTYYITVAAKTAAGTGKTAMTSTSGPLQALQAPAGFTATATNINGFTATWSPNTVPNTPTVTGYQLQYSANSAFTAGVTTVNLPGDATSYTATGLTNSTTYYVRLAAVSALGGSPLTAAQTLYTVARPGTPAAPSATLTSLNTADLAWSAPAANGTPITGYTVTATPDTGVNVTYPEDRTATNATITGLTAGTRYAFTVTATNAAGSSTSVASSSLLAAAAPAQPGAPVVTIASATSLNTTWTAPENNGAAISQYTVEYSSDASFTTDTHNYLTSDTSVTLTGLTTGTPYYIRVKATNSVGSSTFSDASTRTPGAVPTNTTAPALTVASKTTINVTWTAPAANGHPITGYIVEYADNSDFTGKTAVNTTETSYTLTGLTAGATYYVRILAINGLGISTASPASSAVAAVAPDAPANLTFADDTTQAAGEQALTWTMPDNGGLTPTYTVAVTPAEGVTSTISGTTATFTGLTAGTEYTYQVTATTAKGSASATATHTAFYLPEAASAVTSTVALAEDDNTVALAWNAPTFTGGTPITGYTITAEPAAGVTITHRGAETTATVAGVTLGETYTFTITAANSLGTSTPVSKTVLVASAPVAPAEPTLVKSGTSMTATWAVPTANGSPITSYTLQYSTDSAFTTGVTTVEDATTGQTITDLDKTTYYARVKAANIVGDSTWSPATAIDLRTAPATISAPTVDAMTVVSTDDWGNVGSNGTVTWTAPADNGGDPITGYTIYCKSNVNDYWQTCATEGPDTFSRTFSFSNADSGIFTTGQTLIFKVTATNSIGESSDSNASTGMDAVGAPHSVPGYTASATVASPTSITAQWNPNNDTYVTGGSPITGYKIRVMSFNPFTITTVTAAANASSATITGLTAGVTYYLDYAAVNQYGTSSFYQFAALTMPSAPSTPAAIDSFNLDTDGRIAPIWSAPSANGTPIIGYSLQYSSDSTFTSGVTTVSNATSATMIPGFTPGTQYYFRVAAINAAGVSAYSDGTNSSALAGSVPGTPAAPVLTVTGLTTATLSWNAPAANGYAITDYTITATPSAGVTITHTGTATTASITGLTTGVSYSFSVAAINAFGSSSAGTLAPTQIATIPATPAAPTGSFTAAATGINLSWTAPAENGSPITSYIVTPTPAAGLTITYPADRSQTGAIITGLTAGSTYTVTLTAANGKGTSSASTNYTFTAPTAPGPVLDPASAIADITLGTATIAWTAPANDGGTPITGYTIKASNDNGSTWTTAGTAPGNARSFVTNTLTRPSTYIFRVDATNALGTTTSQAVTTDLAIPAAPTSTACAPTFVAGNGYATVAADVSQCSATENGAPVDRYYVQYSTSPSFPAGSTTVSIPAGARYTITGLNSGTTYYFRAAAVNAVGTGTWSTYTSALAPTLPGTTPNAPTLTPVASTAMNVSWSAPGYNGGLPITSYYVIYYQGYTECDYWGCWNTWYPGSQYVNVSAASTTATLTGLTPGNLYYAQMQACTAAGCGPFSASSSVIYMGNAVVPGAPTIGTLTSGGSGKLNVTWSAGTAAYLPTTSYTVQYSTSSTFASGNLTVNVTAPTTSATLTGLTPNTAYYVRVLANNSDGASAYSSTLSKTVVANAPTGLNAGTVTATSVPLTWTAPAGTVTNYSVQYSTNNSTWTTVTRTPSTTTSQTVTGLTTGTLYYFRVATINANGTSDYTASISKTPADAPVAVTQTCAQLWTGTQIYNIKGSGPMWGGFGTYTPTAGSVEADIVADSGKSCQTNHTSAPSWFIRVSVSHPSAAKLATLVATAAAQAGATNMSASLGADAAYSTTVGGTQEIRMSDGGYWLVFSSNYDVSFPLYDVRTNLGIATN